jgi:hypothetical protein
MHRAGVGYSTSSATAAALQVAHEEGGPQLQCLLAPCFRMPQGLKAA